MATKSGRTSTARLHLPWREAGWTAEEAAAHLLDRFAYGPRPGDVERVAARGPARWFAGQLAAAEPEPELGRRLAGLDALDMPSAEMVRTFPAPGQVLRQAVEAGVIDRERAAAEPDRSADGDAVERYEMRRDLRAFAAERGYRRQGELYDQLVSARTWRAVLAANRLGEVMTGFWFNHFNVSVGDPEARCYVPSYERDAVRPNALGTFRALLGATARHPAMLLYLDNARSAADAGAPKRFETRRRRTRRPNAPTGLNENYARELLELHTLGVDGGYDQADVVSVARAFTGWTAVPPGPARQEVERRLRRLGSRRMAAAGVVRRGEFLFRPDLHDAGAKTVLGHRLPAGRGLEDGEEVLDLLVAHPSTARHLAGKLAVRFVADDPPAGLVDRLAAVYLDSGGDLRRLIAAVAAAPELWERSARRSKIKSPFELAVSALRATGAAVDDPRAVVRQVAAMGQPLYACDPPTGWPDRADAWVSTGALLARMNFGLALAAGRLPGVSLDLPALIGGHEPESHGAALERYFTALLPQRDPEPTLRTLAPLVRRPDVARRVASAATEKAPPPPLEGALETAAETDGELTPGAVERVVGLLLGSPEFQRR